MSHNVLVNGTGYKISGGNTLMGGTGYKVSNGRTLIGGTGYNIEFSATANDLKVGETAFIDINGTPVEFIVVHRGNPSNLSVSYDSCSGVWLLSKDVLETRRWNNTSGAIINYSGSSIHSYLNSTFFNKIDNNVRNIIMEVKLPADGTSSAVLNTKIFLLSAREVNNTYENNGSGVAKDGRCLSYFNETDEAIANNKRRAYLNASSCGWWTRSTVLTSAYTYYVATDGAMYNSGSYTNFFGVRPAMVIPYTAIIDDSGKIIG